MKNSDFIDFALAALKNPMQISTVFQTGPWLRDELLKQLKIEDANLIVELGPGAGAITSTVLEKKKQESKYFGIELNDDLVKVLQRKYPKEVFYQKSAEYVETIASENSQLDTIVSSLPWTVFPYGLQEKLLKAIHASLKPGGKFATYVCLNANIYPSAESFKELVYSTFDHVEKSPTVWKNIPPARVYCCTK